mgnify:CR=1 FL=1
MERSPLATTCSAVIASQPASQPAGRSVGRLAGALALRLPDRPSSHKLRANSAGCRASGSAATKPNGGALAEVECQRHYGRQCCSASFTG